MNTEAFPPYPGEHSGTVLVLGNGFTLHDDYARARELRPDAEVIAVNEACRFYRADHVYSYHYGPSHLDMWFPRQVEKFGPGAVCHSSPWHARDYAIPDEWGVVEYWWKRAGANGSSGWMATRLARLMGFDEIILCGVPMASGTYSDGNMAKDFMKEKVVAHYRRGIAEQTDYHAGVYSMSGWTMELFGLPQG